jgi:hypothetical protein
VPDGLPFNSSSRQGLWVVRQHDFELATIVSELGGRGHSAVGVDVEIRRLLRRYGLLLSETIGRGKAEIFTLWRIGDS